MTRTSGERSAFKKARAKEIAEHQLEVEQLKDSIRVLEGSNTAMGKLHVFLETLSENTKRRSDVQEALIELAVPTRRSAALVGLSRTTIYRKPSMPEDHESVEPPNKPISAERAEILAALSSPQFVDLAPLQVYAKLLDAGIYLGSVSTFYRVLQENR